MNMQAQLLFGNLDVHDPSSCQLCIMLITSFECFYNMFMGFVHHSQHGHNGVCWYFFSELLLAMNCVMLPVGPLSLTMYWILQLQFLRNVLEASSLVRMNGRVGNGEVFQS